MDTINSPVSYNNFQKHSDIKILLDSLPYIAAVLDADRNIVYINEQFYASTDRESFKEIIQVKPGQALNCIHQDGDTKYCGTTSACDYCGMNLAIKDSQFNKSKYSRECRIMREVDGRKVAVDYLVTVSSLLIDGTYYSLVTLSDISHEKRRRVLERIFFHDILNKAGSLTGFFDLMKSTNDINELNDYIRMAAFIGNEIVEEIESQRLLMDAETGELDVARETLNTLNILQQVILQITYHKVGKTKRLHLDIDTVSCEVSSDPQLLKRLLMNMMKNALEAAVDEEVIQVGCWKKGKMVLFWVKNQAYMPTNVQAQVFLRSFSTKGRGRGLGTYSMKLLGEQYLGGKVFFESDEQKGTTFYCAIPIT